MSPLRKIPNHGPSEGSTEILLDLEGIDSKPDSDRALARLVVDRGFVTRRELARALKKSKRGVFRSEKRLGDALLAIAALTPNQLARLRAEIADDRTSRSIPGFCIIDTLGKGTSATVYKAHQESLDRIVAVKILPPKSLKSRRLVDAFQEEGKAAAMLNHPNIVQAFDVGRHNDLFYFVMEYVQGRSVHELVKENGAFTQAQALAIVTGIADGLAHAHKKQLVHRDVKPKNILIIDGRIAAGQVERAKLTDLGLARFIHDEVAAQRDHGRSLGTPYFISPEQVRGDFEIGPESDIYSLGATWFYMTTGRPPFTGDTADDVMVKHKEAPIPDAREIVPDLDEGLCEVMTKSLQKEPTQRYRSCEELLTELRAWQSVIDLREGEKQRSGTTAA